MIHLQPFADRRWGSRVLIDGEIKLLYYPHLVTYSPAIYQPMKPQSHEDRCEKNAKPVSFESQNVVLELSEGRGAV